MTPISVIDIFAGPGGLGEGFSAFRLKSAGPAFKIRLSIEKDPIAHQTLELRAFLRQFPRGEAPSEYYKLLRGELTRTELFDSAPRAAQAARNEAWLHELSPASADSVSAKIVDAVRKNDAWVLIGGPPCQAYSLAGRSRNKGIATYNPATDVKQTLYLEYLQILANHAPPVFVMENVKGLLSATMASHQMFERIAEDLREPVKALRREKRPPTRDRNPHYNLYTISAEAPKSGASTPADFLIRSELYGIPQARHRVILVGVRSDIHRIPNRLEKRGGRVSVSSVISDLPPLRSGVSKGMDSGDEWLALLQGSSGTDWWDWLRSDGSKATWQYLKDHLPDFRVPRNGRGREFLQGRARVIIGKRWFRDSRIRGFTNHTTRSHIASDLHRYLFVSAFGKAEGHSPSLADFPPALLPQHANVPAALNGGHFADRFRVQIGDRPSTTIASHISKDGHYYIHPDPLQCRSLTVREAARLQTFPDNYFFCGGRTAQYVQVGNAVPPLLAKQIAEIVAGLF